MTGQTSNLLCPRHLFVSLVWRWAQAFRNARMPPSSCRMRIIGVPATSVVRKSAGDGTSSSRPARIHSLRNRCSISQRSKASEWQAWAAHRRSRRFRPP